jgi:hypothetical protein
MKQQLDAATLGLCQFQLMPRLPPKLKSLYLIQKQGLILPDLQSLRALYILRYIYEWFSRPTGRREANIWAGRRGANTWACARNRNHAQMIQAGADVIFEFQNEMMAWTLAEAVYRALAKINQQRFDTHMPISSFCSRSSRNSIRNEIIVALDLGNSRYGGQNGLLSTADHTTWTIA